LSDGLDGSSQEQEQQAGAAQGQVQQAGAGKAGRFNAVNRIHDELLVACSCSCLLLLLLFYQPPVKMRAKLSTDVKLMIFWKVLNLLPGTTIWSPGTK
jgi:hypothetical protein